MTFFFFVFSPEFVERKRDPHDYIAKSSPLPERDLCLERRSTARLKTFCFFVFTSKNEGKIYLCPQIFFLPPSHATLAPGMWYTPQSNFVFFRLVVKLSWEFWLQILFVLIGLRHQYQYLFTKNATIRSGRNSERPKQSPSLINLCETYRQCEKWPQTPAIARRKKKC